ncbi:hypothetical protein Dsin_022174 [Dipteronia sinensis]|uniref:WLM domain-containing protein n=1 Tax=Dipteronia sinensis TaxID=43782 RepID=A0AAE0DZU0_9ROSI|nr:hypothetical protein Dsin_022174 [Dipteronia sinensis]
MEIFSWSASVNPSTLSWNMTVVGFSKPFKKYECWRSSQSLGNKALKRKPEEEEAKKIVERIAKQVQPIMRKCKWRVKLLSEFCPKNVSFLGLMWRWAACEIEASEANPFDQVLDTMLYELCHNVHSPHNVNFYLLWDELRKVLFNFSVPFFNIAYVRIRDIISGMQKFLLQVWNVFYVTSIWKSKLQF